MPIQDVRQKLGRLLGKERSMRDGPASRSQSAPAAAAAAPSSSSASRATSSKIIEPSNPVVSSPDTFDETKKRVSRLLLSPPKTRQPSLTRSVDSGSSTPSRGRRRVLLQSPMAITAPSKESTPRKRISRSLSPLPTKPRPPTNKNRDLSRFFEDDEDDDDFLLASNPTKQSNKASRSHYKAKSSRDHTPNRFDFPRILSKSDEYDKDLEAPIQPQTRTIFIERAATPSSTAAVNTDESSFHSVKTVTLDPSFIKTSIQPLEPPKIVVKEEERFVPTFEDENIPMDFYPTHSNRGQYLDPHFLLPPQHQITSTTSSLAPLASLSNYGEQHTHLSTQPIFDTTFCTEVIAEMMLWESSVETSRTWADLNRKLKQAEKILKKLGIDHVQYWKHEQGRLIKSDDQYQELPASFVDEILIPLCARHEVRQFAFDEKDSNFPLFAKIIKVHDDFESKMLEEEDTLVHVLVQSNPLGGELVSEVLMASSAGHRIRSPFLSFKGKHGDSFRQMINATIGLVLQKISYSLHVALQRMDALDKAQRIEANSMEESMKMSSKESLLALSLLLNSSDKLTLLFACAAVFKTASIFNNQAWIVFLEADASSLESMTNPTMLKFISPNDQRVFHREIVMPRVPLLQLFLTDQVMQTQTLQVTEASQMAWLGTNGYKLCGEESIAISRTVFKLPTEHHSEDIHSNRYCVLLSTLSADIKKSIQVSHTRDLAIITQTAIIRMVERQRFASKLNLSMATNQLVSSWKVADTEGESSHREVRHLANMVHTNTFHDALGVKSAKLLFSHELAQSLDLISSSSSSHEDNNAMNGYFYQSNGTSWVRYNHKSIPTHDIPWLEDLHDGKVVLFNPGHESHLILKGNGQHNANIMDVSRIELMRFLSYMDDDIWSSILFPINTSQGMAVLLLSNKLDDILSTELGQHAHGVSEANYAFFTAQYVDAIHHIQLLTQITNVVETQLERKQRVSHLSVQNDQSEELQHENHLLLNLIPKLRANQLKLQTFYSWKTLAMERKTDAVIKRKEFMLDYSMSLFTCRQLQVLSKPKDAFFDVVKQFVQKLFPQDRVDILQLHDATPVHLSGSGVEVDRDCVLTETLTDGFDVELYQDLCRGLSTHHHAVSSNGKSRPVAHVTVTRTTHLDGQVFSSQEAEMLEDIIQLASDVYSALHLGMQEVTVEGDIQRWLLVMLQDVLLPLLALGQGGSHTVEHKNRLLRMVTQTVRKLVAADVVILHAPSGTSSTEEVITMSSANPVEEKKDESIWKKFLQDQEVYEVDFSSMDTSATSLDQQHASSAKSTVIEGCVSHRFLQSTENASVDTKLRLVLSKDKQFTDEHRQVITAVLKMLQHHFQLQRRMQAQHVHELTLQEDIQHSSLHIKKYSEDVETLQLQNQFHSLEASFMNQLLALFAQINAAADAKQLVVKLAKSIPAVFPCSKIALVISDAIHFDVSPVMVENFSSWIPSYDWKDDGSDSREETALLESLPRSYTLHQLMQLPVFFAFSTNNPISTIPLYFPNSKRLLGSVLLLRDVKNKAVDIPKHFQQFAHLAEAISKLLSFSTYSICRGQEMNKLVENHQDVISTLQQELQKKEHLLDGWKVVEKDKQAIEEELLKTQQLQRSSVEKWQSLLEAKEEEMQSKVDTIQLLEQQLEESEATHNQHAQALAVDVDSLTERLKDSQVVKERLLELSTKFALDQRCKPETILVWLKEVAETRQSVFAPFSYHQGEQSRASNNTGLQGVHGLWSAAGEAIRTNKSVCFTTTRSNDGEDVSRWGGSAKAVAAYSRSLQTSPHHASFANQIEVCCVPNRAVVSMEEQAENISCFIFIKPKSEKWHTGFSEEDKLLLELAVNVSSRMLLKTVVEVNTQQMHSLEQQVREKNKLMERILTALQMARGMLTADIKSHRELGDLLQQDVVQALTLPHYHDIQLDCQFIPYTAVAQSKRSASTSPHSGGHKFSPKLQDLILEAKTRSQAVRNGSTLLVPLILADGKCHGVILVEKKLNESHSTGSRKLGLLSQLEMSEEGKHDARSNPEVEAAQDLLISDVDYDMVNIFASFAVFILEKLYNMKDAISSLQEASTAIMAIQDAKSLVEERLSEEIAIKLEYEEALRKSADIISTASSQRSSMGQLLESLRSSAMSLTSAEHCYVIMPYAAEHVTAEILLEQSHHDFGSALNGDNTHYTLLPDSPFPIPVRLDAGDIEQIALQHYRSIFLPSQSDFSDFQGLQLNKSSTMCWRSWVIRRIEGNRLLGKRLEENQQPGHLDPPYYAMMVPFYIRSNTADSLQAHVLTHGAVTASDNTAGQGKVALMVVIRQSSAFTECNRECVAWLCQALSFCVATRGGESLAKLNLAQLRSLQEEFKAIQIVQQHYDALVDDSKQMLKFIDNGVASDDHPSVLKHMEASVKTFAKQLLSKHVDKDSSGSSSLPSDKALLEQFEESTFLRAVGLVFERVQYSYATEMSAAYKRRVVMELSTEKHWSDFVVETTVNSASTSGGSGLETVLEPGEELLRYGCFNAKGKFTIKFGYHTVREKLRNPNQGKSGIFLLAHSGIKVAMVRLELLDRIQYYVVRCDALSSASTEEEGEDITALSPTSTDSSNVGFCLINLDLKVRLVERLCETYFTWGKELLHFAHVIHKQDTQAKQELLHHQQRLEEQVASLQQTRLQYQQDVLQDKESHQHQVQRIQHKLQVLDQMSVEAANIPMYLQALPDSDLLQGSIHVLMSWLERFARAAHVDFAMGYLRVMEGNPDLGIVDSMKTVEWIRNERNIDFSPAYSPHSSHDLKKYQVVTILPKDAHILHSKSHSWQQLLLDVHTRFSTAFPVILDPINILDEVTLTASQMQKLPPCGSVVLFFPQIPRGFEHEGKVVDCKCKPFIILTPKVDNNNSMEEMTSMNGTWLRYLVSTLYTLSIHTAQRKVLAKVTSQVKIHRGLHAITKLQAAQQQGVYKQLLQELTFKAMKGSLLVPRLQQQNADLKDSVMQSKQKITQLESVVADWTELAKGVNGACYHVQSGVATLWGRVCSTLMTMLASRCKVQGCGIIVASAGSSAGANSGNKLYEYVVRDITTPHARRGGENFSAHLGDEEYSKGALERRSTVELGNKLNAQLLDIFESSGGSVQRVYRTTHTPRDHDGTESITYLIPVKTAHEVVAVLRISLDSLGISVYSSSSANHVGPSPQEVTGMIESNMVNFAELLAPVVVAAQSIGTQQEQAKDSQQVVQSMKGKLQTLQDQVVNFMGETQVMKSILPKAHKLQKDLLHRFFQQLSISANNVMEDDNIDQQALALEAAVELVRQLTVLLREGCQCEVDLIIQPSALTIQANKLHKEANEHSGLATSHNIDSELDVETKKSSKVSGNTKQKREYKITDLRHPSEIIGSLVLYVSEGDFDRFNHTSALTILVLQPLCALLSHFVLTVTSEVRHQHLLAAETARFVQLKDCYEEVKEHFEGAQQSIADLHLDVSTLQQWTQATSTCLDFITNYTPTTPSSSNAMVPSGPTGNHVYAILPASVQEQIYHHEAPYSLTALSQQQGQVSNRINEALYTLIHFLLMQAMSLLAKQQAMDAAEHSQAAVGLQVCILDRGGGEYRSDSVSKKLIWIHGGSREAQPAASGCILWSDLSEQNQHIVVNVTNLCISTKEITDIEIKQALPQLEGAVATVHVKVVPLFNTYTKRREVVGALQILMLNTTSEQALPDLRQFASPPKSHKGNNNSIATKNTVTEQQSSQAMILLDVIALLSRMVSYEILSIIMSQYLLTQEGQLVSTQLSLQQVETQLQDVHADSRMQHKIQRACMMLLAQFMTQLPHLQQRVVSVQEGSSSKRFTVLDVLQLDNIRPLLQECSVMLKVVSAPTHGVAVTSDDEVHTTLAKSIIPLYQPSETSSSNGKPVEKKKKAPGKTTTDAELLYLEISYLASAAELTANQARHGSNTASNKAYECVDQVSTTVQAIIQMYALVQEQTVGQWQLSQNSEEETKRLRQHLKQLVTDNEQWKVLLQHQEEECKRVEHVGLLTRQEIASQYFHLYDNMAVIVKESQQTLLELMRNSMLAGIASGATSVSVLESFLRQAVKTLKYSIDQVALTASSSSSSAVKFACHSSVIIRKDSLQRISKQSVQLEEDDSKENHHKQLSKSTKQDAKDMLKVFVVDQQNAHRELNLIRDARRSKAAPTTSASQFVPSLLEPFFFPANTSSTSASSIYVEEVVSELSATDLIGLEDPIYHVRQQKGATAEHKQKYLLILVGVRFQSNTGNSAASSFMAQDSPDHHTGCDAVIRFLCTNADLFHLHAKSMSNKDVLKMLKTNEELVKHLEEVALFNHLLLHNLWPQFVNIVRNGMQAWAMQQQLTSSTAAPTATAAADIDQPSLIDLKDHKNVEMAAMYQQAKQQVSRYRSLYKSVLREACMVLLDPPNAEGRSEAVTGPAVPRSLHPAALTPLAASQDSCGKILSVIRTMLKSEGQAILLKDTSTVPYTYQVLYTGDALTWPGVEQGSFGVITAYSNKKAQARPSLVESVVHGRKSIAVDNAALDERYVSHVDGICSLGTPMLAVPLRGRGGSIVGALLIARSKHGPVFAAEDIMAAEMVSSMGSLSLYWCQGLTALHHTLHKTLHKVDKLEKAMGGKKEHK